jgi:hypothetical protein
MMISRFQEARRQYLSADLKTEEVYPQISQRTQIKRQKSDLSFVL